MNKRIVELTKLTLEGKMYASPNKIEYDREDLFLSRQQRESKRLCEFILNHDTNINILNNKIGDNKTIAFLIDFM